MRKNLRAKEITMTKLQPFLVEELSLKNMTITPDSRATLWRMIKGGLLQKIEVLPGSFRLRLADLESIAAGHRKV